MGVEVFWIHLLRSAGNKQKLTKYIKRSYVMPNEIYCHLQLNILTVAAHISHHFDPSTRSRIPQRRSEPVCEMYIWFHPIYPKANSPQHRL